MLLCFSTKCNLVLSQIINLKIIFIMKKRSLKSLKLNKKLISNLESAKGGIISVILCPVEPTKEHRLCENSFTGNTDIPNPCLSVHPCV